MRISDWSSDVCSSDLPERDGRGAAVRLAIELGDQRRRQRAKRRAFHDRAAHAWRQPDAGPDRRAPYRLAQRAGEPGQPQQPPRTEERRVGKELGSTWKYRW